MGLKRLELSSFRALSQKIFSFTNSNLISGKNGSGKTTLLESVYFLIENKSFKTNNVNSFYPFEDDSFALKALFDDNSKVEISRKKSKAIKGIFWLTKWSDFKNNWFNNKSKW